MSEQIKIPPAETVLTEKERAIFSDPGAAKFRLFYEGNFYPVGRMFGADGQIVVNPLHAFGCIAFTGQWVMMPCKPGDIEPVREGRPWL